MIGRKIHSISVVTGLVELKENPDERGSAQNETKIEVSALHRPNLQADGRKKYNITKSPENGFARGCRSCFQLLSGLEWSLHRVR